MVVLVYTLVLNVKDLILLSEIVSLLDIVETFQNLVGEVLLVFTVQFYDRSGFFIGFFENSNEAQLVLNPSFLTLLASLWSFGAMKSFDDSDDVLIIS